MLYLEGSSLWDIGQCRCSLVGETKQSRWYKVVIGYDQPRFCDNLDNHLFASTKLQIDPLNHHRSTRNYISALVLGWCYVLSTRLTELRGSERDGISYNQHQAPCWSTSAKSADTADFAIPVGEVSATACRWWTAVLAHGCGWSAVLHRSGRDFFPPWSCHFRGDKRFCVVLGRPVEPSLYASATPPSSAQAQQLLHDFAQLHNAHDQLLAALAAALTIPEHGRFGAAISLPDPAHAFVGARRACSSRLKLVPPNELLSHFMAFSCTPNTTASSLCGCLWEPSVPCNLASEWLCPVLDGIVPRLVRANELSTIVKMMAARSRNTAPLWLGAAITGILPRLFEVLRTYMPQVSLETATWLETSQSFIHYPRSPEAPPILNRQGRLSIAREVECRLLYLTDVQSKKYASPPVCPWSPPGTVDLDETAMEVQEHARCGHQLLYRHWIWQGQAGELLVDHGFHCHEGTTLSQTIRHRASMSLTRLLARLRTCSQVCAWRFLRRRRLRFYDDRAPWNERLSRSATRNLFTWMLPDGVRPADMDLWNHEWLDGLLDEGTDADTESAMSNLSRSHSQLTS